jgi:high-affinity nickel-transport protein
MLRYDRLRGRLSGNPEGSNVLDYLIAAAASPAGLGVLLTGLTLGIRHGIDWGHIAAITDITSTTAAASAAEAAHDAQHRTVSGHHHGHGGRVELQAHDAGPGAATLAPALRGPHPATSLDGDIDTTRFGEEQVEAIKLGTLYALGHGVVVIALGLAALAFGALLPDWLDPLMGRVVGVTLLLLGVWVLYSVLRYARGGESFRLRSRWMLMFDGVRYAWRRIAARLHGHEHVEPLEMSSYGPRTAFGVGMIHGIGAETGTQVLLIAAVGGAASAGLGVPMLFAFVIGLLISNFAIVAISSVGFVASQTRERVYVLVGAIAGVFSLAIGSVFLLGQDVVLPDLSSVWPL